MSQESQLPQSPLFPQKDSVSTTTETKQPTQSEEALCLADQLDEMVYGICRSAAIQIRRLVPFEAWYEEQVEETNRLGQHLVLLTQQHGRLTWRVKELVDELNFQRGKHAEDRARLQAIYEHQKKDCWYWQDDGENHLESMVNTLPVVITAGQLRKLLTRILPVHETPEMHDAVMELLYTGVARSRTDLLWQAYRRTLPALQPLLTGPASFPERDTDRPAEQQGLFRKFEVRRVDASDMPGGKHHGCEYFVLDMDHDKAAPAALVAYADAVAETHPQLAADLRARFGRALTRRAVPNIEAAAKALAEAMDYPWEGITEEGRAKMRKNAEAVIQAATPAIPAATPKSDPCPSCEPGRICKKPTCGRLAEQSLAKDAARWRAIAGIASPEVTDFRMREVPGSEPGEIVISPVAVNAVRFVYEGPGSFTDAVDALITSPKGGLQTGFTLIELLIVIAVLGILAAILAPGLGLVDRQGMGSVSYGFNGVVESRCIGGYQHTIDHRGRASQTLSADGFGIACK